MAAAVVVVMVADTVRAAAPAAAPAVDQARVNELALEASHEQWPASFFACNKFQAKKSPRGERGLKRMFIRSWNDHRPASVKGL